MRHRGVILGQSTVHTRGRGAQGRRGGGELTKKGRLTINNTGGHLRSGAGGGELNRKSNRDRLGRANRLVCYSAPSVQKREARKNGNSKPRASALFRRTERAARTSSCGSTDGTFLVANQPSVCQRADFFGSAWQLCCGGECIQTGGASLPKRCLQCTRTSGERSRLSWMVAASSRSTLALTRGRNSATKSLTLWQRSSATLAHTDPLL